MLPLCGRIDGVERFTRTYAFDWPALRVANASSALLATATRRPAVPGIHLAATGASPTIARLHSIERFHGTTDHSYRRGAGGDRHVFAGGALRPYGLSVGADSARSEDDGDEQRDVRGRGASGVSQS